MAAGHSHKRLGPNHIRDRVVNHRPRTGHFARQVVQGCPPANVPKKLVVPEPPRIHNLLRRVASSRPPRERSLQPRAWDPAREPVVPTCSRSPKPASKAQDPRGPCRQPGRMRGAATSAAKPALSCARGRAHGPSALTTGSPGPWPGVFVCPPGTRRRPAAAGRAFSFARREPAGDPRRRPGRSLASGPQVFLCFPAFVCSNTRKSSAPIATPMSSPASPFGTGTVSWIVPVSSASTVALGSRSWYHASTFARS